MPNKPETVFYGATPIRTFTMNGRIKYAARDLCGIIGYSRADKMLAAINSRPEYIDAITSGGTQKIRVAERGDIEKILARCHHRNAAKLREWLCTGGKSAGKQKPMTTKPKQDDNILLVFVFD